MRAVLAAALRRLADRLALQPLDGEAVHRALAEYGKHTGRGRPLFASDRPLPSYGGGVLPRG